MSIKNKKQSINKAIPFALAFIIFVVIFVFGYHFVISKNKLEKSAPMISVSNADDHKNEIIEKQQCLEEQVRETLKANGETIRFMENKGQLENDKVKYYFTSPEGAVYVENDRIRFVSYDMKTVVQKDKNGIEKEKSVLNASHTFSLYMEGAESNPKIELGKSFETKYNYFLGEGPNEWKTGIKAAKDLFLRDMYPGIDLRLYSTSDGKLEFDWIIAPGADFQQVKLRFEGQDNLLVDKNGNLQVDLRFTEVDFHIPESYQVTSSGKKAVSIQFDKKEENIIAFVAHSAIDPNYPLVIDPTLNWGTFLDGNNANFDAYDYAIQVDEETGIVYCAGATNQDIITGTSPYNANGYLNDVTFTGGGTGANAAPYVALIYRINNSGTALLDMTMYGPSSISGTSSEVVAHALSLSTNRVFIGGFTTVDIPTTGTPFDAVRNSTDGFVAVFSKDLGTLVYGTYIGSTGAEEPGVTSIRALSDTSFIVGATAEGTLPGSYISAGAADNSYGNNNDMYIARFNNLNTLVWGTYVGSSGTETFNDLEVFPDGRVAFCGSANGTFSTEINSAAASGTNNDGVIGVLASNGGSFLYLDKIGDSGSDLINDVEIVGDTLFFTGEAASGFPIGSGGFDTGHNGGRDIVIGKVFSGGGAAGYRGTFYGTASTDIGSGIKFISSSDCEGNVTQFLLVWGVVGGTGLSTQNINGESFFNSSFTAGGNSNFDMFFATFNSALNNRNFGTYAGGNADDYLGDTGSPRGANHLWVYNASIYLATTTHSASHSPAIVSGGFDVTKSNGNNDAHVVLAIQFVSITESDYSDAPSSYGTPNHTLDCSNIKIGNLLDSETAAIPTSAANGDDINNLDDEDAVATLPVIYTGGPQNISITVSNILNTTGLSANLQAWIDLNSDGIFNPGEIASASIPTGTINGSQVLTWSGVTVSGSLTNHYMRVRITTNSIPDNGATTVDERSTLAALNGEVEDYLLTALPACGTCNVINGPSTTCPGQINGFTAQIVGTCTSPVYTWTVTGNVSSFTPSGNTVSVTAGSGCNAPYTVMVSIACSGCGLSPIVCQSVVQVQDLIAPIITCPINATINCPGDTTTLTRGIATATDGCSTPAITYTNAIVAGACAGTYTLTRTWRATDGCGNTSTCNQIIVVQDTTKPVITCPINATINCPGDTTTLMRGIATATDGCSTPAITYTNAIVAGACAGTYTLTRTWRATDACGNTSTCNQIIVVQDTTKPVITCPINATINCPGDTTTATRGIATATDGCSTPAITYTNAIVAGACAGTYTLTRTWRATDACGNTSTCNQIIVVQDTTKPVITCPINATINCLNTT